MIELNKISRLGFGGYRISSETPAHYKALKYAVSQGCNLIDTAPNYTFGESEKLIGKLTSQLESDNLFITTKAGYILPAEITTLRIECPQMFRNGQIVEANNGTLHSISPDYISRQISCSLRRLKRRFIDGFFLHNPEYYFESLEVGSNLDKFYDRIACAFELLEELAKKGIIRYYGVSSNSFKCSENSFGLIEVEKLYQIAKKISSSNNFKLIQFPFNIFENQASIKDHKTDMSFIDFLRDKKFSIFGNRPLNSNTSAGPVRLSSFYQINDYADEENDRKIIDDFILKVALELQKNGIEEGPLTFIPVQVISEGWNCFESTDLVDSAFANHIVPFLKRLFAGQRRNIRDSIANLKPVMFKYAKRHMMAQTKAAIELNDTRVNSLKTGESLSYFAAKYCLDKKLNHILVGMRDHDYVDDLKDLFNYEKY